MKMKYKDFLDTCIPSKKKQICFHREDRIAWSLMNKGYIEDIVYFNDDSDILESYIWLSKKGVTKATKIQKQRGTVHSVI